MTSPAFDIRDQISNAGSNKSQKAAIKMNTAISSKFALMQLFIFVALAAAVYREARGNDTLLYIGAFNLTVIEPIFAVGSFLLVRRFMCDKVQLNSISILALGLLAIQLLNLSRGLNLGPIGAITSLRQFGVFTCSLVVALCFYDSKEFRGYANRYILLAGYGLTILAIARMLISPDLLRVSAVESEGRAISAQGAFIVAIALILKLHMTMIDTRWKKHFGAFLVMFVTLVLLRQGTALVTGGIGILILLTFNSGPARRIRVISGVSFFLILCTIYYFIPEIVTVEYWSAILPGDLSETLSNRGGTLETRQLVWVGVLTSYLNLELISQIVGIPNGTIMPVTIVHPSWGAVPWLYGYHSMYFQTLVAFGALGAMLFAAILASGILRPLLARPRRGTIEGGKWLSLTIVVMCAIFSYTYDLRAEGGIMLSFGLLCLSATAVARVDTEVS